MTTRQKKPRSKKPAPQDKVKPLRGYPKTKSFATIDEIKAYLDGDKVTCLLCGREYVSLGNHIRFKHEMTIDDYRESFGIPYGYGLAAKPFREQGTRRMQRMRKKGIVPYQPSPETIHKMQKGRQHRRALTTATRNASGQQILNYLGRGKTWQKADYEEFFRRVKTGRTPMEVGQDKDMPSRNAFMRYMQAHPSMRKQYDAAWEKQPFVIQSRANKIGERYRKTLVKLRCRGLTWEEIGKRMQVPGGTLSSLWHIMKRSGRLKKYLNKI